LEGVNSYTEGGLVCDYTTSAYISDYENKDIKEYCFMSKIRNEWIFLQNKIFEEILLNSA